MEITRKELSCDVLIAGGGIGGLVCAVELKEKRPDLDILIVEKQVTGFGGKANKGGGVLQYFQLDKITPMDFLQFHVNEIGCYLGDQDLMIKYVEMNHGMLDKMTEWGIKIPKKPDGSYAVMPTGPFTAMISCELDLCLRMRRTAEKLGVRIMDKTAVAELFTDNGKVIGAAAYSILDDGTFYSISAKKVVLATGSQNYRFGSMWSSGRGDGIGAAYRAGAEMRNAEFGNFFQLVRVKSFHEVVFGENFMYNANNEYVTKNFTDKRETDIPSKAVREWYLNMLNGTGPIHLDYGNMGHPMGGGKPGEGRPPMPPRYGDKFRELNNKDGEIDTDLEVCPMLIGEQSCIKVDHGMQTTIEGLYAIGDASYCGSGVCGAVPAPPARNRGSGILNAVFAGILGADDIAERTLEDVPAICPCQLDKCFETIYAPLYREEGVSEKDVIYLIQKAMAPSDYSVYMEEGRMKEAVALVEEAKALLPKLKAKDMHGVLCCHEAENMVLSAEMHYFASKERKESRGWFLREDYPEMDNENWLKWIVIKNEDGQMTMSTEDVPIEKYPIQPAK